MSIKSKRERFVHEIPATADTITVQRPFKLETDKRRRFIRLEISSPMSLDRIKSSDGGFSPEGNGQTINGTILNISAGGVLLDLDQSLNEGEIVLMSFTLQEVERLENVLGLVKRIDNDTDGIIVGIEFLSSKRLADLLSQAELDLISERITSFDNGIKALLDRYISRRQTVT